MAKRDQAAETDDLEETLCAIGRMWVENIRKPSGMRLVRIANTEVFRRPEIGTYMWEQTSTPTVGYLTDYTPVPAVKKLLQRRPMTITWQKVQRSPF